MIVVAPDGRAWVVDSHAVSDDSAMQDRRADTARRTSTPEGLFAFMKEHGSEEGARLLHDAMVGPGSSRETPSDTPLGRNAKAWGR